MQPVFTNVPIKFLKKVKNNIGSTLQKYNEDHHTKFRIENIPLC